MAKETKWGYSIEPKDYALHPSDAPGCWEWWYFDADFDNGYTLAGTFHFGSPRPPANRDVRFIEMALYDPNGNKRTVRKRYPMEQCYAAEDTCKVVIGPNSFEGEIPRFHLHFSEGGQGCDLTFNSTVEGFMPKQHTLTVSTANIGYVIPTAGADVTGTITWDGKEINVTGTGYHDHNWGDAPMSGGGTVEDLLAFMGLNIGKWTMLCSAGRNVQKLGHTPHGRMHAWKNGKVVAVSYKGAGLGSDYVEYARGIAYPRTYKLSWDEPGLIEGEINLNVTQVIDFMDLLSRFKPFQRWFTETYKGRPAYFRYRVNYDAELTILGEKFHGKGKTWCEHHEFA
jgi:hypothetical protein